MRIPSRRQCGRCKYCAQDRSPKTQLASATAQKQSSMILHPTSSCIRALWDTCMPSHTNALPSSPRVPGHQEAKTHRQQSLKAYAYLLQNQPKRTPRSYLERQQVPCDKPHSRLVHHWNSDASPILDKQRQDVRISGVPCVRENLRARQSPPFPWNTRQECQDGRTMH